MATPAQSRPRRIQRNRASTGVRLPVPESWLMYSSYVHSESKTFEFSFTQMRSLCNHFQNHWDDYIKNAPAAYKFPELLDSYPVFVTLRYGQNRLLNTREGIDDTANAWNAEVDYSKVWRTSFALATHYT